MEAVRKFHSETLLLVIICMAAFLVNNSALSLDIAEAKTLVTARDMVAGGEWDMPTMNGEIRVHKPPLAAWVAAVVEKVYPNNISAQRTVTGVMGILFVFFFFGTARYMERRRGFAEIASMVLLTSYNVIYIARTVNRDIYAYAFMMGAIYFTVRMLYDARYYAKPHKWRWALLAGLMMGLSYLGNGSSAFYSMMLPFIIAMTTLRKPDMSGKWGPVALLFAVSVVTCGWWYLYLWLNNPDALSMVIDNETAAWRGIHVRPWYYYWRFFLEMGIWALFTLAALVVPYWNKRVSTKRLYLICIFWLVIALFLLSIMPEKSMSDLVPLTPPCAMIVGCLLFYYLGKFPEDKWGKSVFYANGYLIAALLFAMPFFVHIRLANRSLIDFGSALFVNVFFVCISYYVAVSTYRKEVVGIVRGVVALFFIIEFFMIGSVGKLFGNSQKKSIAIMQKNEAFKKLPLYHNADEELRIELVYESGKSIKPLKLDNEAEVMKAVPCMVLSNSDISKTLPASLQQKIDTFRVGIFDDNKHPKGSSHYRKEFINKLTILDKKETPSSPENNGD